MLQEFIEKIPKAELHLHIEGSFEPELMFAIAKRNKVEIPYKSVEELKQAYQFGCLQDFLDIYYQGASVLLYERDFYELAMAYYNKCHEQNVLHTEIMFDPQTHTKRGVSFATVILGLQKAREEAKNKWGITTIFIMSYLRHLSEKEAHETLEESLPYRNLIDVVGLDSSELGNPPSKFKQVFQDSKEKGYRLVAHAGEEGPASYIWEAIDVLNIERIDHGNNCLQEEKLVQDIVKKEMALTVCPLSNLELRNVNTMKEHPLKLLMQRGIKVTVNSDDPAYFGGYVNENYVAVWKALDLNKSEIIELVKNSFRYAFISDSQKQVYLKKVDDFVASFS